nr:MAG TPA: hypothetical protein [Caudoviricetes sp.]
MGKCQKINFPHKSHITPPQLPHGCHPCGFLLCDNIDMEDVGNKGCTRRSPPRGLLIFMDKDVF